MELTVDQKSISGNIYTVTEKTQQTYIWSNCTGQILYQPATKLLAKGSRPEAAFLVRQNVTLPVWGLNFQPNKTGFIPRSDLTKKSTSRLRPSSAIGTCLFWFTDLRALLLVPPSSVLQSLELCYRPLLFAVSPSRALLLVTDVLFFRIPSSAIGPFLFCVTESRALL